MTGILIYSQHVSPSTNELYSNAGRRRIKSKKYREWLQIMQYDLRINEYIKGPFTTLLTVDRAFRHPNMDIDNRIKATMDLLQKKRIIENDRFCEDVRARWGNARGGMSIQINPFTGENPCPYCGR